MKKSLLTLLTILSHTAIKPVQYIVTIPYDQYRSMQKKQHNSLCEQRLKQSSYRQYLWHKLKNISASTIAKSTSAALLADWFIREDQSIISQVGKRTLQDNLQHAANQACATRKWIKACFKK